MVAVASRNFCSFSLSRFNRFATFSLKTGFRVDDSVVIGVAVVLRIGKTLVDVESEEVFVVDGETLVVAAIVVDEMLVDSVFDSVDPVEDG